MKIPKAVKLKSGNWNINMMIEGQRISVTAPTKKDVEKKIRDAIAEYMDKADIASKKELDALKKELEELKASSGK